MARIDSFTIPPEIAAEMKAMIKEAPDDAILSYIEATPSLRKGFRPGSKKSIDPIRKRISRMIDGDRDLDAFLLGIMGSGGLNGTLISRLSDLAVLEIKNALFTVYGRAPVLAALLVDYREELREIAIGILEEDVPIPEMDLKTAKLEIEACLLPMLETLPQSEDKASEKSAASRKATPAAPHTEVTQLLDRIRDLEAQLKTQSAAAKREKALRKKLEALNQQKQKVERETRELAKRNAKEEAARADLKAKLQQAHEANRSLEDSIEEQIHQGVEAQLKSVRNRWLSTPLALEQAADTLRTANGPGPLLSGVEQLLARQAEIDRHSGNRLLLRQQIAELINARERITAAQVNALHPLPELNDAETRLSEEISRLQVLTETDGAAKSDFVARMQARINTARSEDELVELQNLLDQLNELNAFSPSELQELYRCCHTRLSIVYAAFTPNVVRKKRSTRDPVWRLISKVEENSDLLIVLDGHNVIHLLSSLFGSSYENGIPGATTRERLVQLMIDALKGADKCQAHIFFDAPHPGREKRSENVWEVYSGGGHAEHRADRAITDYLEYCCKTMSAMPRILITDDRELRAAAVKLGSKFMPVPQFGAFLEEMNT